jgi:uncharacterized zinc-type alcohol dehydrogenase-like protein
MPTAATGWGVESPTDRPHPIRFERRELRPDDVAITISHCGICHSDLHFAHDDWGMSSYPMIPGHEIVGTVAAVGASVARYRQGDRVGVGCLVDSCQKCEFCTAGQEQFCVEGATFTYGVPDRHGELTQGGYSDHVVVREPFVCSIPDNLSLAEAAPLLCAGITTYSPLKRWGVKGGDRVAVVGLGGLGHMALKLAKAMGAEVTVITTSPEKADAARKFGASHVLISTDAVAMATAAGRFHLIVNTIPVSHDVGPYAGLIRANGAMVIVGALAPLEGVNGFGLIFGNRAIAGSAIGGLAETQEMLDFCAEHGIVPEIELIRGERIPEAWETLSKGDLPHRFVIDVEAGL